MGFFDDFLGKIKLMPEEEDFDEDMIEEEENNAYENPNKSNYQTKSEMKSENQVENTSIDDKKKAKTSKVVPMKTTTSSKTISNQSEVCMIMPKGYEDASEIADVLLHGKCVVLNLEGMNIEAAQRIIDFSSGACYTMGGNLQKISKKIFIVTPANVELSGDFTNLLGDSVNLSNLNLTM
mgnify:FL=1